MKAYQEFLASKARKVIASGFDADVDHPALFPFQRAIVGWALRRGRAAVFASTGLGKSRMQLLWAQRVVERTGGRVLILAPLAVTKQTEREAIVMRISAMALRADSPLVPIAIANYEMLEHFDPDAFTGIVLDESSILKSIDGKTRIRLFEAFERTPYKLCATATPAPNDFTELGQHAQFLGVMTHSEMLSMFFVHDGGSTQDWRIKGHAKQAFWSWVCEWACVVRHPRDLGFEGSAYDLPELKIIHHIVKTDARPRGMLFHGFEGLDLSARRGLRRDSISERVAVVRDIASEPGQCLVWVGLNEEGEECTAAIEGAEEVAGKDAMEDKEDRLIRFAAGALRVLVTKAKIAGHGLNLQGCHRMVFCGMNDSAEQFYQAVRRCWRFGQTQPVEVHLVISEAEMAVLENVDAKQERMREMGDQVVELTRSKIIESLKPTSHHITEDRYLTDQTSGVNWTLKLGDCCELIKHVPSDSVGFNVFSPPFQSLYTYSASPRDMGNCEGAEDFGRHFAFLIDELLRVTMPGRLCSVHCMLLPTSKTRDGVIGLHDFRGDIIRAFEKAGWIYHSEVCIWKDPVTAMQRTKALGLLWKQVKKDSCMSRMGVPDYVCTFRKPGVNPEPVEHKPADYPVALWQKIASPIWMDIDQGDTLTVSSAREHDDERHLCALQLEVIRRCLALWSNPGDLVLTPFAGIGSELFEAVNAGRKALGFELKGSYYKQAVLNLQRAEIEAKQRSLFDAKSAS